MLAARLLSQLGIPFVVVFDADRGPASAALDAEIRRSAGTAAVPRALASIVLAAVALEVEPHGGLSHRVLGRVSGAAQPRDGHSTA